MRFIIILLLFLVSSQLFSAATVSVDIVHQENVHVRLSDAALPSYLSYSPIFDFPEKTTFGLEDGSFTLLELAVDEEVYLLYMKGSFISIDLVSAKIKSDAYFLFKRKKDFFKTNVNGHWLLHLFDIENYYNNLLLKVDSLISLDDSYGKKQLGVTYWDKRSSKKLLQYLKQQYKPDQDYQLKYHSPSFMEFTDLLYKLTFQFSGKEIQNGYTIEDQYSEIIDASLTYMEDALTLYHFFRPSSPLLMMESAFNAEFIKTLDQRVYLAAKAALAAKRKDYDYSKKANLEWLFGFEVDEALGTFFKSQEVAKPSLIVFWTTFGSAMDYEYDHLRQLYVKYSKQYNFIYVCANAFEQEQKAKALIRREGLSGYHILPKSAEAFWKSEWKSKRINTLPFFIVVDVEGQIIDAIELPLDKANVVAALLRKGSQ